MLNMTSKSLSIFTKRFKEVFKTTIKIARFIVFSFIFFIDSFCFSLFPSVIRFDNVFFSFTTRQMSTTNCKRTRTTLYVKLFTKLIAIVIFVRIDFVADGWAEELQIPGRSVEVVAVDLGLRLLRQANTERRGKQTSGGKQTAETTA